MTDQPKPDIDIEAEANQCHQWWLDQGTRAGPYHEAWQGWSARASLAAEREREMVDLLLEAQREGCTRSATDRYSARIVTANSTKRSCAMRFLSLFSGIEAASSAWLPLCWQCVAVAEVDPFCCALLRAKYPDVPNLGNVQQVTQELVASLGHVDVAVFGFPCQDLSVAGKRRGLKHDDGTPTRSGLFFDAMRIVEWAKPRWVVVENVPGLFSSNAGRDFACVVGELAGIDFDVPDGGWRNTGVAAGPRGLVEWCVLDAQWFGVPQRRRRVFLVRDSGDWQRRSPLLFERSCLSGNPPPSREAGKGITHSTSPCIGASGRGFERAGETRGQDRVVAVAGTLGSNHGNIKAEHAWTGQLCYGGGNTQGPIAAATAVNAGGCKRLDFDSETLVTHSLRADGFDASEDGTGRGTPLVPMAFDTTQVTSPGNYSNPKPGDPCHPLANGQHPPAIAFTQNQRDEVRSMDVAGDLSAEPGMKQQAYIAFDCKQSGQGGEVSPPLRALNHDQSHANAGGKVAVAFQTRYARNGRGAPEEVCPTLSGADAGATSDMRPCVAANGVRRLTPAECESLQGFPRGYTAIEYRGKPAADGPRYKALGNSMAVPVMAWIGRRILAVEQLHDRQQGD